MAKKEEEKKKKKTAKKAETSIESKSGKKERVETPEEVIDRLLAGYFKEAEERIEAPKDFSTAGIREMLALRAGLFIEAEIREPSQEPPWFGPMLFSWAFPTTTEKVTRTGTLQDTSAAEHVGKIDLYSFIPRPGDSTDGKLQLTPREVTTQ